ncbi:MAG: GmrSD restriction endonuclease domain-containing protein [Planctomycetota bacterium]|jgi:hypothetical protein
MTKDNTLFRPTQYNLESLMTYLNTGVIGLPDIQRPFIWKDKKVRDLLDSMYRGFPVGYLLFWENTQPTDAKHIGLNEKPHSYPGLLIIDGQQRLTSLYSIYNGKHVLDKNYKEHRIVISFRPKDGKFEVGDNATKKDPEFIYDLSEIWTSGMNSYNFITNFLVNLKQKREINKEEEDLVATNINRLYGLKDYVLSAVHILPTVTEEQTAEIFVRINSGGINLNQTDFILTLLSVFGEDIRRGFEKFCKAATEPPTAGGPPSPYNHFIQIQADQLLRVAVAVGFYRGRMKSVYQVLRGKDIMTDQFSEVLREKQLDVLREAQKKVLNLTYWHRYFDALVGAGYRSSEFITSDTALLYSYAFYLIGKTEYNIPDHELHRLIGRWFYMISLSGRYTSSPESQVEEDLNVIKEIPDKDAFVGTLNKIMRDTLTNDFWAINLPNNLETSSSRSPSMLAFFAAQNFLKAPVLFSHKSIPDMLDPALKAKKKTLDHHHLFPRGWLRSQGIVSRRIINQVANLTLLEWPDNISIQDKPPREYIPIMKSRFSTEEWTKMHELHALPENWEDMAYDEFLSKRRVHIAGIIKRAYEAIG